MSIDSSPFEIEKGVELPKNADALSRRGAARKYPWPDMAVGDSVVMPNPLEDGSGFVRMRNSVNVYNNAQRKKGTGIVLVVGSDEEGNYRVWRKS